MLLLFVSAAWGSAFPLMKDLIVRLPVEDLLAERYAIAALTLLLLRPGTLRGLAWRTWGHGVVLGVMFGVGQLGQAIALHSLPSAVSGFAVGCSVIFTPILALLLFRTHMPVRVWVGVALAVAGMTVFTLLRGVGEGPISLLALGVTLAAAALYAGHTLLLARLTRTREGFNAYALTVIQLATIGLMTGGYAVRDGLSLPAGPSDWVALGHLSVVSCALGFLARSYGQTHVAAVPSAVLMSSQPLWVAGIAVIWFHEPADWSMALGGGLMGAAMLLAVPSRTTESPRPASVQRVEPRPVLEEASRRNHLLAVSRQASMRLADLKIKRDGGQANESVEDPVGAEQPQAPSVSPGVAPVCVDIQACRLQTHQIKGSGQPSLDRLIQRATIIVRARNLPGPGCCQSVTLSGRCLCSLIEEAEKNGEAARPCWFRPG
ncbi:DMT family transporter [Nonomuraea rhodomycinica]|uniref:DMT family transporter n=1 Tax=Nonomuraea rhodomycinica TaxID=1712872 RepID=A0A7Y6IT47_9ACTN|nr:DMT family transporter [Nonomuraea rhodomycinica]NUW42639.1 DMT family transporter [Nonomuraea rhodomycinica]